MSLYWRSCMVVVRGRPHRESFIQTRSVEFVHVLEPHASRALADLFPVPCRLASSGPSEPVGTDKELETGRGLSKEDDKDV